MVAQDRFPFPVYSLLSILLLLSASCLVFVLITWFVLRIALFKLLVPVSNFSFHFLSLHFMFFCKISYLLVSYISAFFLGLHCFVMTLLNYCYEEVRAMKKSCLSIHPSR